MIKIFTTAAFVVVASVPAYSQDVPQEITPDHFKSRAAISAVKSYLKVVEKSREEFHDSEQKAREKLSTSLADALETETKAGHLEEGVKLKNAIETLKSSSVNPDKAPPPQPIEGIWTLKYTNGATRYYLISAKPGYVEVAESKSLESPPFRKARLVKSAALDSQQKQKTSDDAFLLDFGDQKIERLNFVNDRVYAEH